MGTVLVITSGKGGVGKTTSTAALGAALAQDGQNVVVVDFDVGLRNLDLVMGAERRVVFDLINVVNGDAKLSQALIRDKRLETLSILPASQTRDKDALTEEGVARVIGELREKFDWVICDSPAGIERGATLAMRHADTAVVVTNPEVSSVRDSDRIIGLLDSKTEKAAKGERIEKHLLLTRYDPRRAEQGEMLKVDDVLEILSIPLLGIIPESPEVIRASNMGSPVTLNNAGSAPARAYLAAAKRLRGEAATADASRKKACSADFFGGKPHERAEHFQSAAVGSGRTRTSPASSRARAHCIPRPPGSFGASSRRDLAGDRQARCGGHGKSKSQPR
jgi:septum site-determining protein MinD